MAHRREWLAKASGKDLRDEVYRHEEFERRLEAEQAAKQRDPAWLARQEEELRRAEQRVRRRQAQQWSEEDFWRRLDVSPDLGNVIAAIEETNNHPDSDISLECQNYRWMRSNFVKWLQGDERGDRYRWGPRTVRYEGHASIDLFAEMSAHERALRAQLHKHRHSNWDLVLALREAAAWMEALTAKAAADPAAEQLEARITRGPDRQPRKRKLKAKPTPKRPDRGERLEATDARVLALLGRHPDGLSLNQIQRTLKAGRVQVGRALDRLGRAGSVIHVRIGNDSRYMAHKQGGSTMGAEKAP